MDFNLFSNIKEDLIKKVVQNFSLNYQIDENTASESFGFISKAAVVSLIGKGKNQGVKALYDLVAKSSMGADPLEKKLANKSLDQNNLSPVFEKLECLGEGLVANMFGGQQSNLQHIVSQNFGLSSKLVNSLLLTTTPLIMSAIKKHVVSDAMKPTDLINCMNAQKTFLKHDKYSNLFNMFNVEDRSESVPLKQAVKQSDGGSGTPNWLPIIAFASVLLAGLFVFKWFVPQFSSSTNDTANIENIGEDSQGSTIVNLINHLKESNESKTFVLNNVNFSADGASLTTESHKQLDALVNLMVSQKALKFELQHQATADAGSEQSWIMSKKRAEAIRLYLLGQGIGADRVHSKAAVSRMKISGTRTKIKML